MTSLNQSSSEQGKRLPSLRKIAEVCGVSATTVSKALKDDPVISKVQREKIRAVAKRLRYRPNRLVDGIMNGRVRSIAIVRSWNPNIASGSIEEVILSAVNTAFERGFCSILLNTMQSVEKEARCLDLAMQNRVSGLIISSLDYDANKDYFEELIETNIPFVIVEPSRTAFDVPRVHADNYHMGYEVTKYLLSLGHRRIAHLGEPRMMRGTSERFEGYRAALEEAGVPLIEELVASTDFSYASGMRETALLMDQFSKGNNPGFSALVACNFNVAFASIEALEKCGMRVPNDVSVAGSGLYRVFPHFHRLKLTTFDQLASDTGQIAADLLIDRILDEVPVADWNRSSGKMLKGNLIVGDTTQPIG